MTTEGTIDIQSTPRILNLNETVRSVLQTRLRRRSASGTTYTLDLAANLPVVRAYREDIEYVLSTLVANAEDAIGDNPGTPGQIHVKTAVHGGRVQVTVTDNGRGLNWRQLSHLFGEQTRDEALTVCAELVKDNGGDLYAWSRYGNGSLFTLDLPVHASAPPNDGCGQNRLRGKRILVVDDEVQITAFMSAVLEQHGAKIDLANSGLQAVEQIKNHKNQTYDLLICDQRMPDLSGENLYRCVESIDPSLRDRFLFVTGDVSEDMEQFLAEKGLQCIRKPFRSVELIAAAQQVLSRSSRLDF